MNETPADSKTKIDRLERTILELGAEVYNLKGTIRRNEESHENFLNVVKGLKQLLDEKGLITLEDFEAAVELGQAIDDFNPEGDRSAPAQFDASKKSSH